MLEKILIELKEYFIILNYMFVSKTEFKFRNLEQEGDRMSINKTAVKTMDILELFYEHEELSLTEMVQLTSMPKTSVYRLIGSLEEMEFYKKRKGKYHLGVVFLRFGQLVSQRLSVRNIAIPYMKELRDSLGQAVNLIIQDGNDAIYVEKWKAFSLYACIRRLEEGRHFMLVHVREFYYRIFLRKRNGNT